MIRAGDTIRVEAYKADGKWYRKWSAKVESLGTDAIVTISPPGGAVEDRHRGNWITEHILRGYYWFDQPYNLIEVFQSDGHLKQIYVNIASLPEIKEDVLRFTDYELDVARILPGRAKLYDQDEFLEAAKRFGYTETFQREVFQTAQVVLRLTDEWQPKPAPKFGE